MMRKVMRVRLVFHLLLLVLARLSCWLLRQTVVVKYGLGMWLLSPYKRWGRVVDAHHFPESPVLDSLVICYIAALGLVEYFAAMERSGHSTHGKQSGTSRDRLHTTSDSLNTQFDECIRRDPRRRGASSQSGQSTTTMVVKDAEWEDPWDLCTICWIFVWWKLSDLALTWWRGLKTSTEGCVRLWWQGSSPWDAEFMPRPNHVAYLVLHTNYLRNV